MPEVQVGERVVVMCVCVDHRQPAEKWREISTLSTPDWCCARPTGERCREML